MTDDDISVPAELVNRKAKADERLESVRSACRGFGLADRFPDLAVYVTGSIGRREGGVNSDLDIFCVDVCSQDSSRIGKLDSIQLFSDLIAANEAGGFPKFSGDGRFLVVHHVTDVLRFLGTSDDDHRNLFTARMLLLLDSKALVGSDAYRRLVDAVIDFYWRDWRSGIAFKPTFLINDLVRYWKTLCLAHEAEARKADDTYKQRRRMAVLKLEFNRMWMIFNGLAFLLYGFRDNNAVTREHAISLVGRSPLERVLEIAENVPATRDAIQGLLDEYSWFLRATDRPKAESEEFFASDRNYREGRTRGDAFGRYMSELVSVIAAKTPIERYLLI